MSYQTRAGQIVLDTLRRHFASLPVPTATDVLSHKDLVQKLVQFTKANPADAKLACSMGLKAIAKALTRSEESTEKQAKSLRLKIAKLR